MILSHRRRLIFIKGVKVGGTSVEMAMAESCGPDDIVTPIMPRDEIQRVVHGSPCRNFSADRAAAEAYLTPLWDFIVHGGDPARLLDAYNATQTASYVNHMSLAQVEETYHGDLSSYLVVGVVRSPYSKILSLANWERHQADYHRGSEMTGPPDDLREAAAHIMASGAFRFVYDFDRYRRRDGTLALRPLRYNMLQADLAQLWSDLGVTPPDLPHAKRGVMADTLDPALFLTDAHIIEINRVFAAEFDEFGFQRL